MKNKFLQIVQGVDRIPMQPEYVVATGILLIDKYTWYISESRDIVQVHIYHTAWYTDQIMNHANN